MTYKSTLKVFVFFAFIFAFATIAEAQATRTWVSGVGDDVNPCSRTAPCKTFAGAISKTATNGEINCLDPAGYGSINVTKSITIDCEDTQGSILAAGVTGVIVNITAAADTKKAFKLRGVSINAVHFGATAFNGIRILAASFVQLDEVVIDGVTQHGISIEKSTAGLMEVQIQDTHIRSYANAGLNAFITGGSLDLQIANSQFNGGLGALGVNLSSNTRCTISGSQIHGNSTAGVQTIAAEVSIVRSTISGNGTGVISGAGGVARFFSSIVTQNTTGISSSGGGQLISHSLSNVVVGNGSDGAFTSSPSLQ
jgi:hypothetical protein